MDTLLLTCHFLFEQKQLSPQTACSGGLWVLLAGSDLFTQPRDKSGSPSSPWSNTHQQQHHSPHSHADPPPFPTAPPTPEPPPANTQDGTVFLVEPLNALHQRCVWSPLVLGESAQASLGAP